MLIKFTSKQRYTPCFAMLDCVPAEKVLGSIAGSVFPSMAVFPGFHGKNSRHNIGPAECLERHICSGVWVSESAFLRAVSIRSTHCGTEFLENDGETISLSDGSPTSLIRFQYIEAVLHECSAHRTQASSFANLRHH